MNVNTNNTPPKPDMLKSIFAACQQIKTVNDLDEYFNSVKDDLNKPEIYIVQEIVRLHKFSIFMVF